MLLTELLDSLSATRAGSTRIDEASDAHRIPNLEFGHLWPNPRDVAGHLVARNHGICRVAPLSACLMNIGVTDPTVLDLQKNVIRPELATSEIERFQFRFGSVSGVTACR